MAAYFNEPDNSSHGNDGGPNSVAVSGSILTLSPVSKLLALCQHAIMIENLGGAWGRGGQG